MKTGVLAGGWLILVAAVAGVMGADLVLSPQPVTAAEEAFFVGGVVNNCQCASKGEGCKGELPAECENDTRMWRCMDDTTNRECWQNSATLKCNPINGDHTCMSLWQYECRNNVWEVLDSELMADQPCLIEVKRCETLQP